MDYDESAITVHSSNFSIKSKLLIAADGKMSPIRKFSKMTIFEKKYDHNAMVLNLCHSKNHNNFAYEIFTKNGPLAILPMTKNNKGNYRSSVIWSQRENLTRNIYQNNKNFW